MPSIAEYMHNGETAIRLGNDTPRMVIELKSEAIGISKLSNNINVSGVQPAGFNAQSIKHLLVR